MAGLTTPATLATVRAYHAAAGATGGRFRPGEPVDCGPPGPWFVAWDCGDHLKVVRDPAAALGPDNVFFVGAAAARRP